MRHADGRRLYTSLVEFGRNDHREDAPHFINEMKNLEYKKNPTFSTETGHPWAYFEPVSSFGSRNFQK